MTHANIFPILLFPLAGVLLNGFGGKKFSKPLAGLLGCASVGLSFLWSVKLFFALGASEGHHVLSQTLYTWISTGTMKVDFALMLDPLSSLMTLIVTGVGFLIHVYSTDYMSEDENFSRYFTYLNLFIFSMLILVLAKNFLLMFVGWELVGLCSYLLIGFWYEKTSASDAGKKAFLVNRIGDFGFLIGLFLVFVTFKTFDFHDVFLCALRNLTTVQGAVSAITLFLFIGACGKSAQIPLYVWLPDAMEGPSPVSALIHAATMVTAGVYMIARCHVLFVLSPGTLLVVASVGGFTAFFAATMALVQNDIKRILAYSTISQLGYMFLACGSGAFVPAVFHLTTHAFFKALLFLGAGSVMHALSGETDIRKMGELSKHLPVTTKTFLIGALSLAGILPFSGFFSKDEILTSTILSGQFSGHLLLQNILWILGILTVLLTAFYTFRLVFVAFYCEHDEPQPASEHGEHEHPYHPHESPPRMVFALLSLAILSTLGGLLNFPDFSIFHSLHFLPHFLVPVFSDLPHVTPETPSIEIEQRQLLIMMFSMVLSLSIALSGIYIAMLIYLKKSVPLSALKKNLAFPYHLLQHKYYVDEIYFALIVHPARWFSENILWKVVDIGIIDTLVHVPAFIAKSFGSFFRTFQTGYVRNYALLLTFGATLLFYLLVLK